MSIPFLELKPQVAELRGEIDEAIARVVDSGWFILGPEVEAFEEEFARYVGAKHCVGVGSGLDALVFALRAMDIGPGDEVIVPAHTFIATWLAVAQTGARVVGVDIDPTTCNLDAEAAEAAITPSTKAIIPVHLYGQPADIDAFAALGEKHGIRILFDAAQAHGATRGETPIGSEGSANAWSFYPGKNLGAFGDGGAITTNDDALAAKARLLRNYGSPRKYEHEIAGGNSRLDPIQAAVLRVKLRHLSSWNERRRALAAAYRSAFDEIRPTSVAPLAIDTHFESAWHLYVVRCTDRAQAQARLREAEIGHLIHYPKACHLQGAFRQGGWKLGDFPRSEAAAAEVLSLPMSPHHPLDVAERVVRVLASD